VAAEHDNDAALAPRGPDNRIDDTKKVARHENIGKRGEKGRETSVVSRRMREFLCPHFVRATRDGNGPNRREIRLTR
jgi:hypothetical protein